MNEIVQGGLTANKQGKVLESQIKQVLISKGYKEITKDEKKYFVRAGGDFTLMPDHWFCEQLRLERNLYGAKYAIDFYVYDSVLFPDGLSIESKWQGSSGSVDEKYVFTVLTLKKLKGHKVLILAGNGAREGAIAWINQQAFPVDTFDAFTSLDAFIHWANSSL